MLQYIGIPNYPSVPPFTQYYIFKGIIADKN